MTELGKEAIDRRAALGFGLAAMTAWGAVAADPTPPTKPEGYSDQLSYLPGDKAQFHISSAVPYRIEIARLGTTRKVVMQTTPETHALQPIPADASSHGCSWKIAHLITIPEDWVTGYYTVRMIPLAKELASNTGEFFFVVRPKNPGKSTRILLQLSTNTYNAYTNWGGYSLYAYNGRNKVQGRRVSFDRPLSSQFPQWEYGFVQWAEANGYTLDYCVNSDLEFHPELLKSYRLVLSVGHDEYWSKPMRDNLEAYIGNGGNVAFFSGNTCCWQVRTEDKGRALTCWKQSFGDDPYYKAGKFDELSTLWSHHLVNRPENKLTGVGFLWGGYHKSHGQYMDGPGSYICHRPDHWLYAGTGLRQGDRFGAKLPGYKVVGYECDGCELTWEDGFPRPTGTDGTPNDFLVVGTCPAKWHPDDCEWYERWAKGRTGHAVLGTYTRGGTVVTVGSTDWSHGLRGNDPAITRITKNVLDRLSQ